MNRLFLECSSCIYLFNSHILNTYFLFPGHLGVSIKNSKVSCPQEAYTLKGKSGGQSQPQTNEFQVVNSVTQRETEKFEWGDCELLLPWMDWSRKISFGEAMFEQDLDEVRKEAVWP